jgi:hypothetical protein
MTSKNLIDLTKNWNIVNYSGVGTLADGDAYSSYPYWNGLEWAAESAKVHIGGLAGVIGQNETAIAIGVESGYMTQGVNAIAIGSQAARFAQGTGSIAIGNTSGDDNQGSHSIAIGYFAGSTRQGTQAVAIGLGAGSTTQGVNGIAIGSSAGSISQKGIAVAIGYLAGQNGQQTAAIAVGISAGGNTQGQDAVAIGANSGFEAQGSKAIAVGLSAGFTNQGAYSIAIGAYSGYANLGANSIAIGGVATGSTVTESAANSIQINATNNNIDVTNSGLYVAPIRDTAIGTNVLTFDTTTKEIKYNTAKTFVIDHPFNPDRYLVHACLEGPEAGVYYRGKGQTTKHDPDEFPEISTGYSLVFYDEILLPEYTKAWEYLTFHVTVSDDLMPLDLFPQIKVKQMDQGRYFAISNCRCTYDWLVFAQRSPINCEPRKEAVILKGNGPYTYLSSIKK